MTPTLIYCYDPMCSWCWGFKPVWESLKERLQPLVQANQLNYRYCVGGLAPDADVEMEQSTQLKLQSIWRNISEQLGTEFNHKFWRDCKPRRSTYPACRACIVARQYGLENEMITKIQHAYYLNAQNPSDLNTLTQCAIDIGIDEISFSHEMVKLQASGELEREIHSARHMRLNSFPSLAVLFNQKVIHIPLNYTDARPMADAVQHALYQLTQSR